MKILFSILLTAFAVVATAQQAEVDIDSTYFHPAASLYIQGQSIGASNLVVTGLSQFPNNGKLLRLKELLDQEQEKKKDQDKDQDKDKDQDQDQDQNPQDPNDDPQDQDPNEDNSQDQDQENDQDPNEDDSQDPSEPSPQPPSAEQMSQDEAERLLDAMKQEEEAKRLQLHPVMGTPVKVDKDW
ncbi:MAG: hypothetical protein V5783_01130 [Pontiella sp.]